MYMYSFEKLEVWQLARKLVKEIYDITKEFPDNEKYGLTKQIRRAAISVSSNIAEGTSRKTGKEQARFTQIAYSSLIEILNQLILSVDLGLMKPSKLDTIRIEIEELSNKLNALYSFQIGKHKRTTKQINKLTN